MPHGRVLDNALTLRSAATKVFCGGVLVCSSVIQKNVDLCLKFWPYHLIISGKSYHREADMQLEQRPIAKYGWSYPDQSTLVRQFINCSTFLFLDPICFNICCRP